MSYAALGQTVKVSEYSTRGACADGCLHACFNEYGDFVMGYVPLAAAACQAVCMDRSGCTDLPIAPGDDYGLELPAAIPASVPGATGVPGHTQSPPEPSYPWGAYSDDTKDVQLALNDELAKVGLCPLAITGVLDAATCGALAHFGEPLKSCEALLDPAPCPELSPSSGPGLGTFLLVAVGLGAAYLVLR